MSNFPGNRGNIQHFNYNDGNKQVQYFSQSWGSSQNGTPAQNPMQIAQEPQSQIHAPAMPQMLPLPDFTQLYQEHMALHQAGMQSAMDALQASMSMMPQLQPLQQPALMPPPQPAQIQHFQTPPQMLPPPQQPLQITAGPRVREIDNYSSSSSEDERPVARRQPTMSAQREQNIMQEAAKVQAELRRLSESHSDRRKEQEANDRQLDALRTQIEQMHQERAAAEQRHSQVIADMARAQAPSSQPTNAGFDMATLQRIIGEVQSNKISKDDIKQLIEDAVSKQLAGVAESSDIASAASRMEKELSRMTPGATVAQVQQIVQQELATAVQRVAIHMPSQQQRLEGVPFRRHVQTRGRLLQTQPETFTPETSSSRDHGLQNQVAILPTSASALTRNKHENSHPSSSSPAANVFMLPLVAEQPSAISAPRQGALSRLQTPAGPDTSSSKSHRTGSRVSDLPTAENAVARVKHHKHKSSKSSKMSTISVQPSASNALVKPSRTEQQQINSDLANSKQPVVSVQPFVGTAIVQPGGPQQYACPAQSTAIAQIQGGQLHHYGGQQPLETLRDDFPDNASQVSLWQRRKSSKQPMADQGTVATAQPTNMRPSRLRQLANVPEADEANMPIVKQKKGKSGH